MSTPEIYEHYLNIVNEKHETTPLLVEQLKKDFGNLLHKEPDFRKKQSIYESLFDWIYPVVAHVYKTDKQRFTTLVYTIDASYMKKKFGRREESEQVQWTHAILLRECLKIYLRTNFS